MATKTIVRYEPPNDLVGQRELRPVDLELVGIFTQQTTLVWDKRTGFWLDADTAQISTEVLNRLESEEFSNKTLGYFTVEQQEVPDEPKGPGQTTVASGTTARNKKKEGE